MNKYLKRFTLRNTSVAESLVSVNSEGKTRLSYRGLRWLTVIAVQLFFILSFRADIQILEGTLAGSRFLGFHMIDPFISLQYIAANRAFPVNLTIGTVTVVTLYLIFGRAFCGWVCPYGLISELGEKVNDILVSKKIIRSRKLPKHIKYCFWALFLLLCFTTGYLVFELVNVMAVMSRLLIYGIWASASVMLAVFAAEVYSRRVWCRSVCPVGTTYGLLNRISAIKVSYGAECDKCGSCKSVCHAPHLLDMVGTDKEKSVLGADCTMCGRCVDVCHKDTLRFRNRLKRIL
jgi:ferredoxin-type protein NapH